MNGYRVCRSIRSDDDWTPILMLTAKSGEYDEAEGLETGADDFLTKPFSMVVLQAGCVLCCAGRGAASTGPPSVTSARPAAATVHARHRRDRR